jgi:hypothetical protein
MVFWHKGRVVSLKRGLSVPSMLRAPIGTATRDANVFRAGRAFKARVEQVAATLRA